MNYDNILNLYNNCLIGYDAYCLHYYIRERVVGGEISMYYLY